VSRHDDDGLVSIYTLGQKGNEYTTPIDVTPIITYSICEQKFDLQETAVDIFDDVVGDGNVQRDEIESSRVELI
jgi:hypothetical protein